MNPLSEKCCLLTFPPEILRHTDPRLPIALRLIHDSFAYMEGRITPPSSIRDLDLAKLAAHTAAGELVVIGDPPVAAMIMQHKGQALYLGKIAVDITQRGRGLARQLIVFATETAKKQGLDTLTLQSRVELAENHAAFRALGFVETGHTTHEGYDKPTSITFTKTL